MIELAATIFVSVCIAMLFSPVINFVIEAWSISHEKKVAAKRKPMTWHVKESRWSVIPKE